jgi:hypothetical protein
MNSLTRLSCLAACLLHLLMLDAQAFFLIVTNLQGNVASEAILQNSAGALLPLGSLGEAMAVSPPVGYTATNLAPQCGISSFWAASATFGNTMSIGRGTGNLPGTVQAEVQRTLLPANGTAWIGKTIFLAFYNAPTRLAATEWILLEFPLQTYMADSSLGLELQASLNLSSATVRVGQRDALGNLSTVPIPNLTTFDSWSLAKLPSPYTAAQRAKTADPDQDGLTNLMEFALGTQPANRDAANGTLQITATPANATVTLSWQEQENLAHSTLRLLTTDGTSPWGVIPNVPIVVPPVPLPAGLHRRQITLPINQARKLFRLSATLP